MAIIFVNLIVVLAVVFAMQYKSDNDQTFFRFTSTPYGKNNRAIFEIKSNSDTDARLAAANMLAIYRNDLGNDVKLRWETIEELDPKTKQVLTVLYKLPDHSKSSVKVTEQS